MNKYRIILVDDHAMLREGIKKVINEAPDMIVVAEANNGAELLNLLEKAIPDMVILDISMPGVGGIKAAGKIKIDHPEVKVLILSMHKDKEYLYHAISAGADGYLLKQDTGEELFKAIQVIRKGKNYLSSLFAGDIAGDLLAFHQGDAEPPLDVLTKREREILTLVADGKTSRQIAETLFISSRTVEHHRASIAKKLNISNVADLVKYAISKKYTSHKT